MSNTNTTTADTISPERGDDAPPKPPRFEGPVNNRLEHGVQAMLRQHPKTESVAASCPRCGFIDFVEVDAKGRLLRSDRRFRRLWLPAKHDGEGEIVRPERVAWLHRRCNQRVRFRR